ncbi:MAG: hypothetical protein ACON35_05815 [Candidatus Marinamargulisbacteria bacterium]
MIDNLAVKTTKLKFTLIATIMITLSIFCYAETFRITNVRIGPNPIIRSRDGMVVNYVSTRAHQAKYYVFSVNGEQHLQKKFEFNIPNITNAGECQFELFSSAELSHLQPQLYIVILETIYGTTKKVNKEYVIIK